MIYAISHFVDEWHGGYAEVGCFKDRPNKWSGTTRSSDAIRGRFKSYSSKSIVEDCYNRALSKRNTHFAIKNNRDCYTSSVAHKTYDKYGHANGCINGKGGDKMLTVYKLLPGRLDDKWVNLLIGLYVIAGLIVVN